MTSGKDDLSQYHAEAQPRWPAVWQQTTEKPDRRTLIKSGAILFAAPAIIGARRPDPLTERFRAIEANSKGRLGVAVLDSQKRTVRGWRMNERFPMCSTFKVLAAGLVLHRVAAGLESLHRRVVFGRSELVANSPITSLRADGLGMTVGDLCEAAITVSDNTAGNLLLASFGGPKAVTRFARHLGDRVSRLDRNETSLNEARAGDPRDTTAPASMAHNLRELLLGTSLEPSGRSQLQTWLLANRTGAHRLRAGLPVSWRMGDKTGTGENGTANDLAIAWPPNRLPVIIASYLTGSTADAEAQNETIASVAYVVAREM